MGGSQEREAAAPPCGVGPRRTVIHMAASLSACLQRVHLPIRPPARLGVPIFTPISAHPCQARTPHTSALFAQCSGAPWSFHARTNVTSALRRRRRAQLLGDIRADMCVTIRG